MSTCFPVLNVEHLKYDVGLNKKKKKACSVFSFSFLKSFKTTYMKFLVFADLSAKGHPDSKTARRPQNQTSSEASPLPSRCCEKMCRYPLGQPSAAHRRTNQPAAQALNCLHDIHYLTVPALLEGPLLTQVVAKARVVSAHVIVRMTV